MFDGCLQPSRTPTYILVQETIRMCCNFHYRKQTHFLLKDFKPYFVNYQFRRALTENKFIINVKYVRSWLALNDLMGGK